VNGRYIPPRATPTTTEAVFASLRRAAPTLGPESLLVLSAQIDLESGSGAATKNYNTSGAKCRVGSSRWSWSFHSTHEGSGAERRPYEAPPIDVQPGITATSLAITQGRDPAMAKRIRVTCFRAFETLDEATADHVALIRDEFSDAWPHVLAGRSYDFGLALADDVGKIYHSSDREAYARAISQRFESLRKQMPRWHADA